MKVSPNAQKIGVRFGAKQKLFNEQIKDIQLRIYQGEFKADLAKEFGISRQTLYVIREMKVPLTTRFCLPATIVAPCRSRVRVPNLPPN